MDQKLYDSYVKDFKKRACSGAWLYRADCHCICGSKSTRSTRTDAGIDRALLQWKHHQKRKGC